MHITDQCFMKGNYEGNDIDVVDVTNPTSCQEKCQDLLECKYWTYKSKTAKCWLQTANAPKTLGSCITCTRGPRNCPSGK